MLGATRTVSREHFMPPDLEACAYEDSPQPLPRGHYSRDGVSAHFPGVLLRNSGA